MLVKFVTTVAATRTAAWAFAAEFSNIGAWDPGVKAAKKARARAAAVASQRRSFAPFLRSADRACLRAVDKRGRDGRGVDVRPDDALQGKRERDDVRRESLVGTALVRVPLCSRPPLPRP